MFVEILSPSQVLFYGEQVEMINLPSPSGYIEILKGHAPLITQLAKGKITVVSPSDGKNILDVEIGGLAKVEKDKIIVLIEG